MKKCPFCAEEIQDEAIVCRYCGRDLPQPQPETETVVDQTAVEQSSENEETDYTGFWTILVILSIFGIAVYFLVSNNRGISGTVGQPRATQPKIPDKVDASLACHEFVKDQLKAPSTADFPSAYEDTVITVSSNEFEVMSYVDAENSFGVPLRNTYDCRVFYSLAKDSWFLRDLQISP